MLKESDADEDTNTISEPPFNEINTKSRDKDGQQVGKDYFCREIYSLIYYRIIFAVKPTSSELPWKFPSYQVAA